jgi:hypothetical protein
MAARLFGSTRPGNSFIAARGLTSRMPFFLLLVLGSRLSCRQWRFGLAH